MLEARTAEAIPCPDCGTEVAAHFLVCPGCHRLLYAEQLKLLAEAATAAEAAGDWSSAMSSWRSAMELLPPAARQYDSISKKVAALGSRVDATPGSRKADASGSKSGWAGAGGVAGLGTIGLMIWKFKFVAVLLLTKGKLLLLGLTKASTLLSMFVTVGAYWTLWGWPFAIGLVVVIYIHEMGHVAAFMRYGVEVDAPMFIPGVGAFVRGRQRLANVRQEAQVGLAGPIWGAGSVLACYALYFATGQLIFAGIARLAAILNLLNLIPIAMLDGGMAFRAFSRSQRWFAAIAASAMWAMSGEADHLSYAVLFFMMIVAAYRAGFEAPSKEPDLLSAAEYVGLVVALSLATQIPAPIP